MKVAVKQHPGKHLVKSLMPEAGQAEALMFTHSAKSRQKAETFWHRRLATSKSVEPRQPEAF